MEGHPHESQRPHVVVVPYPSQGHINPLLQFAKHLVSKSVKATIATTHYTVHSITAPNINVEPISDGFDDGSRSQVRGNEKTFLQSFKSNGSKTLSNLITKYEKSNHPVNCIVYDSFLPWALDVAKQHKIYGAAFFTNSATVCAIFCYVFSGQLNVPLVPEEVNLALSNLPVAFKLQDLPSFLRKPESYPAYLSMKLGQFDNLHLADWAFCNTFHDLEPWVTDGPIAKKWPAKLIGPMVPSAYLDNIIKGDKGYGASLWNPLSQECKQWLNSKPPKSVVYISFGSMVSPSTEQMEQLANGLEESNLHFLWVIRDSQLNTLPKSFVHKYYLETTSSKDNNKGMIVAWCNQLEVLAHEAIGCFMTHCGWNSTLEGISLGVPMIGVPQWSDQLPDALFIEEVWGVGVRAKEDENGVVRKEEILLCLKEAIMEGKRNREIKKNVSKWKESAKKALAEGGSSYQHIDDFVRHLRMSVDEHCQH